MNTESIRPDLGRFALSLYHRPIHPELLEVVASRRLHCRDYTLTIRFIPSGHAIVWEAEGLCLVEVAAPESQPLPENGRLIRRHLQGEQTQTVIPQAGFCYQVSAQFEALSPELFAVVQAEILVEAGRGGLAYFFPARHRLALPPVSVAVHDAGRSFVSVSTFHTFPDQNSVLKIQSLFEFGL